MLITQHALNNDHNNDHTQKPDAFLIARVHDES